MTERMTPKVGDWVRYKHVSGTIILGIVLSKEGRDFIVHDWLSDEVVTIKQILEIRQLRPPQPKEPA